MAKFDPVKDIPDLAGKVAIVTGGNRGMGLHITEQLAIHGAKVYLACRSEASAQEAIALIESQNTKLRGANNIVFLHLDLSTIQAAHNAAKTYLESETKLHILIHNAAVMSHSYGKTADGLEDSFAVNHLAPFVFTKELLPTLISTSKDIDADVRVVTVTSEIHSQAPTGGKFFTVDEINDPLASDMFRDSIKGRYARYARSKLANILFAKQLQKNFDAASAPAISVSVNPGGVATDTVLNSAGSVVIVGPILRFAISKFAKTSLDGASSALYAATSPEVKRNAKTYSGAYLMPIGKIVEGSVSKDAQSAALAERLWKASEDISEEILAKT